MTVQQQPQNLQTFYETDYARAEHLATVPDEHNFMYAQTISEIRPYLKPGAKVLDLGCNDGNLSLFMARANCEVLGIDLARNAVELAQKSAAHHGINGARFESLDFLKDWSTPDAFDFILCSHVIEHVPEDAKFAEKICFALKPGGHLVLLAPTQYSSLYRASKFFIGRYRHDEEVGHLRRYTGASISETIERAGLHVKKVAYADSILRDWFLLCRPLRVFNRIWAKPGIRRIFNAVDGMLARIMCPATVCVHAQKALR